MATSDSAPTPADSPGGLFSLGVASGDPTPDGVVLWTRLAPRPLLGGGMSDRAVPVQWEIAHDELFRQVVARGEEITDPRLGHSIHAEISGLEPDREYYYRFKAGNELSRSGRTRTAPATDAMPSQLRFAFASCQDYEKGFYTAYQHLLQRDIRFVMFLGDYIYESAPTGDGVRRHEGLGEPITLVDYRNRYARYKTDKNLQDVHAAFPWIVAMDDHEIDNNWAGDIPHDPGKQSTKEFLARRRAAMQAFYEHMPLRRTSLPNGASMQIYRRLTFGRLAALHMLDTRQFRTDQPRDLRGAFDPRATMLGEAQEQWLMNGIRNSGAVWNLLGNQVMWASNRRPPPEEFDFDNWDGYQLARRRMLEFFYSQGRSGNVVILTGDRHATWASNLLLNFTDPASPIAAVEITGPSITSGGDPNITSFHRKFDPLMFEQPHWKYIDPRRGFVECEVTEKEMTSTLWVVSTVRKPVANLTQAAEFLVVAGRPGLTVHSLERSYVSPTSSIPPGSSPRPVPTMTPSR